METLPTSDPTLVRQVAFVSVGQTPRTDVMSELLDLIAMPVDVFEVGVLDGVGPEEIAALAPRGGEGGIITRLADGQPVVLSKPRITERMADLLETLQPGRFDLVVVLSTGLFREFESSGPMVNAQRAMEAGLMALAADGQHVGIIQPLDTQVDELDIPALRSYRITATHATEGDRASIAGAVLDLADCEIVVLNSIGFSEADRQIVAKASGKPVVLARRMIASAVRLLLASPHTRATPAIQTQDISERIERLTPREKQVLSLVAEGLSNKAIARQLDISPKTVEIHRANMMTKMEVSTVGALIRLVLASEPSLP